MRTKTKTQEVAEAAARKIREAVKLETKPPLDFCERALNPLHAQRAREEAVRLMEPPERIVGSNRTEIVPAPEPGESCSNAHLCLVDTLETPNMIAVAASEQRADALTHANVLSLALDAAESAQASNSIEKMLCHQMAALHDSGMQLLVRVVEIPNLPIVEHARLVNAAARVFEVYQSACLTLQKLKTKGQQHVVVSYQQVNVAPGGKALVAGRVGRGSRRRGRSEK